MDDYPTRDSSLVGAAGVHFVVSELSLRGLIALPTIRNTAGIDALVSKKEGTWHANLQVKSSRNRVSSWPISIHYEEWIGPDNYYVFLRYDKKEGRFEVFLETAKKVAENARLMRERDKQRGIKEWAPYFWPKDQYEGLKTKWEEFGRTERAKNGN